MRRCLLRPLEAFCRHTAGLVQQCEIPGAGCGASELLLHFSVVHVQRHISACPACPFFDVKARGKPQELSNVIYALGLLNFKAGHVALLWLFPALKLCFISSHHRLRSCFFPLALKQGEGQLLEFLWGSQPLCHSLPAFEDARALATGRN